MQINHVYGVVGKDGIHHDVSRTERGAKQYATKHGYTQVSVRFNGGYNVAVVAEKISGKWMKVE